MSKEVFPVQHSTDKEPHKWATITIMDTVRVPTRLSDGDVYSKYINDLNTCGGWPAVEVSNFTKSETFSHEEQRMKILESRQDLLNKTKDISFQIDIAETTDNDVKIRIACMNSGEVIAVDSCSDESSILTEIRKQLKKMLPIAKEVIE